MFLNLLSPPGKFASISGLFLGIIGGAMYVKLSQKNGKRLLDHHPSENKVSRFLGYS